MKKASSTCLIEYLIFEPIKIAQSCGFLGREEYLRFKTLVVAMFHVEVGNDFLLIVCRNLLVVAEFKSE